MAVVLDSADGTLGTIDVEEGWFAELGFTGRGNGM